MNAAYEASLVEVMRESKKQEVQKDDQLLRFIETITHDDVIDTLSAALLSVVSEQLCEEQRTIFIFEASYV